MIFCPVAQQPNKGLGRLIVEVSRSHIQTHTHTHTQPAGLLWTNEQLVAEAATYTTHNRHKRRTTMLPMGFETAIQERAAADLHLRPHVHRDRLSMTFSDI
jgi:predicted signal transduction protein with EAL and GGDEF domain